MAYQQGQIFFRADAMREMGIAPSQLRLMNSSCQAQDNSTHYVLIIDMRSVSALCGSEPAADSKSVRNHVNVIPMHPDEAREKNLMMAENDDEGYIGNLSQYLPDFNQPQQSVTVELPHHIMQ